MMSYDYPHPVSRTYQYKKITKPLLERKRRARINRCLDELKDLMVDALETEGEDISKLEKADILELTVRHLQRLQASRSAGLSGLASNGEEVVSAENRWLSGFGHCAAEACRFLAGLPGEAAERLAKHLAAGLQTNRQSDRPAKARSLLSPALASLERTANLVSPCATSPTADVTRTASYPEVNSDNSAEAPVGATAVRPRRDSSENQENVRETNPKTKTKSSRDRTAATTKSKFHGTEVHAEDDEEIDVERVDEADPMWRPW